MSFLDTIRRAKTYLEENGRVSLRALKREFDLDDDALEELVEELREVQQVATLHGNVLSWGGTTTPGEPTRAEDPAAHLAGEAERRQLTVMFCDLVGSTELSQRLDPEDLRTVVRAYQESAAAVIERYAGHIAQYLGDGLLVYFGYPHAHEDDAERAVRAGREILTALGTVNETLERQHDIRLAARVGIHTGPVVVGEMGGGAKSETLALGDTTNIAARIEAAADPNSVVISDATLRLVAGMFVVEDRGPATLKGVREPVTLYLVGQPSGVRSRLDVAAGRLTRFVGREVELATLVDRWQRAQDGEGQNVLILGEAGGGKSRLVYQLHEHLAAVPHTWLECGATPYTQGTPFHPLIALVAQGLAFAADDTVAEKLGKMEVGLRSLASEETVALLADFLGLPPPAPLQMSPELQRRKTLELLAQWTLSLSAAQPLVMFIEDLHWCDASTLELLGHLIAQSPTARLLLLATGRPEFVPPWLARSNLTTLPLTRLTKRQARDMATALGGPDLPADTLDALVTRADGVPLYVEELTKATAESGAAHGVEAIPATLADSLMARLDRLSTAKEVAQRAAVLGRELEYPLLAATAAMDEVTLRQGLARLVDAEVVYARGEPPAATYTFKHALLQEAAYESLLKRTRQQLHARVVEVLQERFPERVEAEPEVMARHCDRAALIELAVEHYQRAGERAMRRSANEEAIGHLRRALDLIATAPETGERDRQELALQLALGAPLIAARGWSHQEYEQTFLRAHELVSRIGESPELPRVLAGVTDIHIVRGDLGTALGLARETLTAAEHTGAPFDLLTAHEEIGVALLFQGHFSRALRHFERCSALYDPGMHASLAYAAGFDRGVYSHMFAGWCHMYLGRFDRALEVSDAAVMLARRGDHPFTLAQTLFSTAVVSFERGEPDRAYERVDEVVDIHERLGFPIVEGWARSVRGWILVESGEGEAGVAEMQQALDAFAEIRTEVLIPSFVAKLAAGLRMVGRRDDALGVLDRGLAQAEVQTQQFTDGELRRLRAEILLDMDENAIEEAEAYFGQSLEIARRQEAKTFELRTATSLARLWQRQGKRDAARALLAPVYAWFTEGFATLDLRDAKGLLEELE